MCMYVNFNVDYQIDMGLSDATEKIVLVVGDYN